jgi:hypothetical protein
LTGNHLSNCWEESRFDFGMFIDFPHIAELYLPSNFLTSEVFVHLKLKRSALPIASAFLFLVFLAMKALVVVDAERLDW